MSKVFIITNVLTKFQEEITPLHLATMNKELAQNIIGTNLLTKFHEDWKINVASREKCPALGQPFFQPTGIIFELVQDIIRMNLLTKFDEDLTANVASRTNPLTKFHEDWTINVASRVLTRKTAPPTGGHVFSPIWTIFELVRDINETNVLNKFHDNWAKIVTSRVFTRNTAPPPWLPYWASNLTSTVFTSFELSRGINGANLLTKFHED
ncbi:hypothetical protein DPMN_005158 [Dreissena polymorpha]|uniref:Uncharacterized protein n=1 Tax=Dreissena polymorpha TaxID=45954 RepID=A0A9D4RW82_DREPO|nr:hypothetical protein DPMN_005158 [Dreissena polymorpha]